MSASLGAADDITKVAPAGRCYEGASAKGQLKFRNGGLGWALLSEKTQSYVHVGPATTLAMGFIECCAELGRGQVFWMLKGTDTLEGDKSQWTATTVQLPSLLKVDYVWGEGEKEEWLKTPHCHRLDSLNARAGALNLNVVTMPIHLNFEVDNYNNVRIYEGLAPINLYHNSSGYTYLRYTADMSVHMQSGKDGGMGTFWQASKDVFTQFMMRSGPMVVTQLRSMYKEARPETLWFFSTLIKEAIKGHNGWVENGGYTIEGDKDLGPSLARKVEEAIRAQNRPTRGGNKLEELRDITDHWDISKQVSLQQYFDAADNGDMADLSRFMVFDDGWSNLTKEEKGVAIELWALENEDYQSGGDGDDNSHNSSGVEQDGAEDMATSDAADQDADLDVSDLDADPHTPTECTEPGSNVQCDNPSCTAHT